MVAYFPFLIFKISMDTYVQYILLIMIAQWIRLQIECYLSNSFEPVNFKIRLNL